MSFKKNKDIHLDNASLKLLIILTAAILVLFIVLSAFLIFFAVSKQANDNSHGGGSPVSGDADYPFKQDISPISPSLDDDSILVMQEEDISAQHGIIINLTDNKVIASRQSSVMIYPASLTKVMTLIVAVENLKSADSLNDVLTISATPGENSGYGLKVGEKLTVEDLLYASILQSDGVACLTLADYIAGSEANFVKLMNEKAKELGIDDTTLFQNCTGLHHQYHYSTSYDMAVIMSYAVKNIKCYEILSALSHKPSDNFRPGEGCTFWHMVIHERLADGNAQPKKATITAGKTGFTTEAEQCLVTYARGDDGKEYIVVTAEGGNVKNDHINIYNEYVK